MLKATSNAVVANSDPSKPSPRSPKRPRLSIVKKRIALNQQFSEVSNQCKSELESQKRFNVFLVGGQIVEVTMPDGNCTRSRVSLDRLRPEDLRVFLCQLYLTLYM
jgi:hypothetical protein